MAGSPPLDIGQLTAIDVHVHAEVSASGGRSLASDLEQASTTYFKMTGGQRPTLDQIAAYYRQR